MESGLAPRQSALRRTFVWTHTLLRVDGGAFVSLLEPLAAYQEAAVGCRNDKTWPVLVGEPGRDLDADRQSGHRFFFSLSELEPVREERQP